MNRFNITTKTVYSNNALSKKAQNIALLLSLPLLVAIYFGPTNAYAKMYKWVDENGEVHYSDKLPPQSSKKAHKEMNSRGIVTREVNRAKSTEEIQNEKAVAKALEAERRAAAQKAARERMRDKILLDTFTTERDLTLTRDERLGALDSLINITVGNNERLAKKIEKLQSRIKIIEGNGRTPPGNLNKELRILQSQSKKNTSYITAKQSERDKIAKQFENDLIRYRELKQQQKEEKQKLENDENTIADSN